MLHDEAKEIEEYVRNLLKEHNVILEGHFIGTSGKHMSKYVNKDIITENPKLIHELARIFGSMAHDMNINVDVAIAPTMGAVVLGNYVALHMDIKSVFCEKDSSAPNGFVFKRGYDKHLPDKNAIVIEDILNTGGSAIDTIKTAKDYKANVKVLFAILNRQGKNAKYFGVDELVALVTGKPGEFDLYNEEDCPLCKTGIPVNTEVGHGAKFLEKQKQS